MSVNAIFATLPYALKIYAEEYAYKQYVTRCLRLLTENSALAAQGKGKYFNKEYDEIINPKPTQELKKGDATERIRAKLR